MISSKYRLVAVALAAAASLIMRATPGVTEDSTTPAGTEQTVPAAPADPASDVPANSDSGAAAPAASDAGEAAPPAGDQPAGDSTAAQPPVAPESTEQPADQATAPPAAPETQPAAAQPESPSAAQPQQAASSNIDASQLQIGTAVFGADGAKIGEVNGVKTDDAGKVQEILVTDGVAAGLNAKAFAVSGDKITGIQDGVKLSLSSEEAKKLPIVGNGNG